MIKDFKSLQPTLFHETHIDYRPTPL